MQGLFCVIANVDQIGGSMHQWTGRWRFGCYTVAQFYGRTGTATVSADTEDDARQMIKYDVARELGAPMVHDCIEVSDLRKKDDPWG